MMCGRMLQQGTASAGLVDLTSSESKVHLPLADMPITSRFCSSFASPLNL